MFKTWKPKTIAELAAIAQAKAEVEAQGFTPCESSAHIAELPGVGFLAWAFSEESVPNTFGSPAAHGRVLFDGKLRHAGAAIVNN